MDSLVDLTNYRRAQKQVTLQPDELRALMNLYSRRVMSGEWKDYAIDFRPGFASFSMFKHTFDLPAYSIVKLRKRVGGLEWLVFKGKEQVNRGRSITDALTYFDNKLEIVR